MSAVPQSSSSSSSGFRKLRTSDGAEVCRANPQTGEVEIMVSRRGRKRRCIVNPITMEVRELAQPPG